MKIFIKSIVLTSFIINLSKLYSSDIKNYDVGKIWQDSNLFKTKYLINIDKKKIAYHEAGHILIAHLSNFKVKKSNIDYTLNIFGETTIENTRDTNLLARYFLAGYVAEEIIYGKVSAITIGSDLNTAIKYIILENKKQNTLSLKDINSILKKSLEETRDLVKNNLDLLEIITKELLEKTTLDEEQIHNLLKKN